MTWKTLGLTAAQLRTLAFLEDGRPHHVRELRRRFVEERKTRTIPSLERYTLHLETLEAFGLVVSSRSPRGGVQWTATPAGKCRAVGASERPPVVASQGELF